MKKTAIIAFTIASAGLFAQVPTHRVFLIEHEASVSTGTVVGGNVVGSTGPVSYAGKIMEAFSKGCPNIAFTRNRDNADYVLEYAQGATVLSNAHGDVLAISKARFKFANIVKDVCPKIT